jgi:hypothetical protein
MSATATNLRATAEELRAAFVTSDAPYNLVARSERMLMARAAFNAAFSADVVLALLDENAALRAQLDAMAASLCDARNERAWANVHGDAQ